jgi:hypothetical protein
MSQVNLPYAFANGDTADASKVVANLIALRDFINNELIKRDASTPFSGFPDLPSGVPVSDNSATHKKYVDDADAPRIKTNINQTQLRRGSVSVSTDAAGVCTVPIPIPAWIATSQVIVVATGTTVAPLRVSAKAAGSFSVTSTPSTAITFDWVAFGQ